MVFNCSSRKPTRSQPHSSSASHWECSHRSHRATLRQANCSHQPSRSWTLPFRNSTRTMQLSLLWLSTRTIITRAQNVKLRKLSQSRLIQWVWIILRLQWIFTKARYFPSISVKSPQLGHSHRQRLPSHLQHHFLVHHHSRLHSHRYFTRIEQCRGQGQHHLQNDRCQRKEGQLNCLNEAKTSKLYIRENNISSINRKTQ